jgi:hypothetical protein
MFRMWPGVTSASPQPLPLGPNVRFRWQDYRMQAEFGAKKFIKP